jgi:hypothetical protein
MSAIDTILSQFNPLRTVKTYFLFHIILDSCIAVFESGSFANGVVTALLYVQRAAEKRVIIKTTTMNSNTVFTKL